MAKTSTSFKPGNNANPNGRPKKGYSITEWFREMLKSQPDVKDKIGQAIILKALKGDSAAQKLVWNYMDGLPQQKVDLTSNGNTILVEIKDYDGSNKSYNYSPAKTEDSPADE